MPCLTSSVSAHRRCRHPDQRYPPLRHHRCRTILGSLRAPNRFRRIPVIVHIAGRVQTWENIDAIVVTIVVKVREERVRFGSCEVVSQSITVSVLPLGWIVREYIRPRTEWIITVAIAVSV